MSVFPIAMRSEQGQKAKSITLVMLFLFVVMEGIEPPTQGFSVVPS
jgi:hypothetical protein